MQDLCAMPDQELLQFTLHFMQVDGAYYKHIYAYEPSISPSSSGKLISKYKRCTTKWTGTYLLVKCQQCVKKLAVGTWHFGLGLIME